MSDDVWMRCSACKDDIKFRDAHFVCSVSTCNRRAMRLVFCSVACWDSHLGEARHRDAGAVEARAPSRDEWQREQAAEATTPTPVAPSPPRRIIGAPAAVGSSSQGGPALSSEYDRDVLIVISKMKKYIKDRSGMSTSDSIAEALSDHVRALCDEAIRTAGAEGRKTVLDRDIPRKR